MGTRGHTGLCIEAHDLAAAKLVAHREKDRVFVATLLNKNLIEGATLIARIARLPVSDTDRDRLSRWVEITIEEISES
ncbi:MAG: hypothetical protein Q8M66_06890 [Actinomycetota bacterium]|nr:hypothetical protein [Actinomycetota bacterium]